VLDVRSLSALATVGSGISGKRYPSGFRLPADKSERCRGEGGSEKGLMVHDTVHVEAHDNAEAVKRFHMTRAPGRDHRHDEMGPLFELQS
jgi:hypothetical protein